MKSSYNRDNLFCTNWENPIWSHGPDWASIRWTKLILANSFVRLQFRGLDTTNYGNKSLEKDYDLCQVSIMVKSHDATKNSPNLQTHFYLNRVIVLILKVIHFFHISYHWNTLSRILGIELTNLFTMIWWPVNSDLVAGLNIIVYLFVCIFDSYNGPLKQCNQSGKWK